jgi:hypothetical protein
VLRFERQVVDTLTTTSDPELRRDVATYVDECLRSMPEHLRAGVVAESLALGAWSRVRSFGRSDRASLEAQLARWEHHPVDVVRQYVRLIGSLVLFAEVELGDARAEAGAGAMTS